ncbi:MAG: group 1 glycosyl transferase [Frankiales bacterium]|nr:group 1 glycosyl transferase [Frankiales bacterium]
MREVVFVTSEVDPAPTSGGSIRTLNLVTALARRARTHLVVVGHQPDVAELRRVTKAVSVQTYPASTGLATRVRAYARGWPLSTSRWWSPDAASFVRARQAEGALCVIDHVYLDPYRPPVGPYVLSLHNVEYDVQRELPRPQQMLRGAERQIDLQLLRRLERRAVGREDSRVVTVSRLDLESLGTDGSVVPNGTAVPDRVPPLPEGGRITYIGSMSWPPNRLAVEWWLANIAPQLPGDLPRLTVVGRGGAAAFRDEPRLDVLDEVPSVSEVLAQSSIVAIPLQHGGGTRLKVLEAMAFGRPVVSTRKGVEGLPVEDGLHALLADEPTEFAAAVTRAWTDRALALQLSAAGRRLAAGFDWTEIADDFAELVLGAEP